MIRFPSAVFTLETPAESQSTSKLGSTGRGSSADVDDDSSSEADNDYDYLEPPKATGFKLNLGGVKANQVDNAKPKAIPHTPKGEVVKGLQAAASSAELDDDSSSGDDEPEPPKQATGKSSIMGFFTKNNSL